MPPDAGVELSVSPRSSSATRCSYCHDDLDTEPSGQCPGCNTLLHKGCAGVARTCPMLGCAFQSRGRIRILRTGATAWQQARRALGGIILPLMAFCGSELGLSEPIFRMVDDLWYGPLYHPEAQRFVYPLLAWSMLAFGFAQRGRRESWITWGLVVGVVLSALFSLLFVPLLPMAAVGVIVLVGILGFSPYFAFGSYVAGLYRYVKAGREPPPEPDLGPWGD